ILLRDAYLDLPDAFDFAETQHRVAGLDVAALQLGAIVIAIDRQPSRLASPRLLRIELGRANRELARVVGIGLEGLRPASNLLFGGGDLGVGLDAIEFELGAVLNIRVGQLRIEGLPGA